MATGRYNAQQISDFVQAAMQDGFVVLRDHLSVETLATWREAFAPLLKAHIAREGHLKNRGSVRYYVTLPFVAPFAEPTIFEDEDVLAVVKGLVGDDAVMCQLATDTPLRGSDYQDIHRDAPPGEIKLEPILLKLGDVMIRDVRGLHRGTPNRTDEPSPMVVIGYSRRWLFRPEVNIRIPRATWEQLSERARFLLRFNLVVESPDEGETTEKYQAFAY